MSSTLMLYLWGFLVVFIAAIALGSWTWGQAHRHHESLWTYFVMALIWPLFVCAVLFLVLWSALTRSSRDR